jgi:hypothetical protein
MGRAWDNLGPDPSKLIRDDLLCDENIAQLLAALIATERDAHHDDRLRPQVGKGIVNG